MGKEEGEVNFFLVLQVYHGRHLFFFYLIFRSFLLFNSFLISSVFFPDLLSLVYCLSIPSGCFFSHSFNLISFLGEACVNSSLLLSYGPLCLSSISCFPFLFLFPCHSLIFLQVGLIFFPSFESDLLALFGALFHYLQTNLNLNLLSQAFLVFLRDLVHEGVVSSVQELARVYESPLLLTFIYLKLSSNHAFSNFLLDFFEVFKFKWVLWGFRVQSREAVAQLAVCFLKPAVQLRWQAWLAR